MHQKHSHTVIDYRNARYQGSVNQSSNRHGLGIMVDDDLSFYVSQWNNNLLNGETLVYISHGKYIYGSWQDNEPHGINVFRTGETVLVGEFENGRIINKVLVIFQKYNIIAVLETSSNEQQFEVISCGKLLTHDDLTQYIQMLDIQMPQNYFSLIKFVTSLTDIDHHQSDTQSLIASPCERENCYFGYRDGLAIVFNPNNGVVSVGQHQNKKVNGFGGKFDGKKIQQGNFELQQTITYQKKRPNNQIYTIFQKLHKRSLNFKNQYFDSKVKTLGDLQSLLRGNIQKIVNYNMKNGLRDATAGELNDSLDYQVMDEYDSIKAVQNRQAMYEKETPVNMKKTVSSYYKEQRDTEKTYSRSSVKQNITQSYTKRQSKIQVQPSEYGQFDQEQTQRRTPRKDSTVYYAKKSPIRFKEEERNMYEKQSRTFERQAKNYEKQPRVKKYIPESQREQQVKISERPHSRISTVSQHKVQNNRSRSPMNYNKNIEQRATPINNEFKDKLPKFGGLQFQETQKPHHKSTFQYQVEEYKKVLQKSRSRQKLPGQSLGKYLKRPNYEDIEERRKRILGQFKQLNQNEQTPYSQVSKFSEARRTPQRGSIQIDINESSRQSGNKQLIQSPCMKEKILSFTSQNDIQTENSSQGYLPLSLVNNERAMRNNNRINNKQNQQISNQKTAFGKKQSTIDRLEFSNGSKMGKQNINYTPGSFAKYKKDLDDIKVESLQSEKKNDVRRFYCKQTERTMQLLNMTKKPLSQHVYSQNQQQEDNQFSQIQLKCNQPNRRTDRFVDKVNDISQRQDLSRTRPNLTRDREPIAIKERDYYGQKQSALRQRENLPIGDDISRRRKGYKYYFDD